MKKGTVFKRGAKGGPTRKYWYIGYPDPMTGERRIRRTDFLIEDPTSKRRARIQVEKMVRDAAELLPTGPSEAWESWVPQWMRLNFGPKSLSRYETAWQHLKEFLTEQGLASPRTLRYVHAGDYLAWRTSQRRRRGTFINYNTALVELRFLGSVMREAVRRELCPGNPISQLGLGKRDVKEKPEITDPEDLLIRSELDKRPAWMRECYHIAMCQGCRLMETMVPMEAVDLTRGSITFKGKGNKVFTTQIHPSLRPLAEAKKKEGRRYLCDLPPMPAKEWWKFFREVGLPHLCFHCTKVTLITRLCRAGVPQGVAMSYVNHSREEVHRIYQRLKLADVSLAVSALASIPAMAAIPGDPTATVPPLP